jgi:hypothetical protein
LHQIMIGLPTAAAPPSVCRVQGFTGRLESNCIAGNPKGRENHVYRAGRSGVRRMITKAAVAAACAMGIALLTIGMGVNSALAGSPDLSRPLIRAEAVCRPSSHIAQRRLHLSLKILTALACQPNGRPCIYPTPCCSGTDDSWDIVKTTCTCTCADPGDDCPSNTGDCCSHQCTVSGTSADPIDVRHLVCQ